MLYVLTHKDVPQLGLGRGAKWLYVGGARGRDRREGCVYDDVGSNISDRNAIYSELTGLYYLAHNCTDEVIGVCHYRRFFCDQRWLIPLERKITAAEATRYTFDYDRVESEVRHGQYDVLLPRPRVLLTKRGVKSIYGHFAYHKGAEVFEEFLSAMRDIDPENYASYRHHVMTRRRGSYWNMLVARREMFADLCDRVFRVLFSLEERLWDSPQGVPARMMGYLSESLLPFYVERMGLGVRYRNVVYVTSL